LAESKPSKTFEKNAFQLKEKQKKEMSRLEFKKGFLNSRFGAKNNFEKGQK
jgi:hypothetical protein